MLAVGIQISWVTNTIPKLFGYLRFCNSAHFFPRFQTLDFKCFLVDLNSNVIFSARSFRWLNSPAEQIVSALPPAGRQGCFLFNYRFIWPQNHILILRFAINISYCDNKYCDTSIFLPTFNYRRWVNRQDKAALLLLGETAPVLVPFWLGVVRTFLLCLPVFLPDAGVGGAGNANASPPYTQTFSFCSLPLSLLSDRCCGVAREASGERTYRLFTDGDSKFFREATEEGEKESYWKLH